MKKGTCSQQKMVEINQCKYWPCWGPFFGHKYVSLFDYWEKYKAQTERQRFATPNSSFSPSFALLTQAFFCQCQLFWKVLFAAHLFIIFSSRGNKPMLVFRGRVQYFFLSRWLGFVVPRDHFCPEGLPFCVFPVHSKSSKQKFSKKLALAEKSLGQ